MNPVFPAGRVPHVYNSFEELEEVINAIRAKGARRGDGNSDTGGGENSAGRQDAVRKGELVAVDSNEKGTQTQEKLDEKRGTAAERVDRTSERGGDLHADGVQSGRNTGESLDDGHVPHSSGEREVSNRAEREGENQRRGSEGSGGLGNADGRTGSKGSGLDVAKEQEAEKPALPRTEKAEKAAPKVKDTDTQSAYAPVSKGFALGTLVPKNLALPLSNALQRISEAHGGDIDAYVAKELGFESIEAMHEVFAAEQVDALGMALHHMSQGKGFILGRSENRD